MLLVATAPGLGVLANAAAGSGVVPRVIATREVGTSWNGDAYLAAGLPVVAVIAGLMLIRWWPWLLLAGSVLTAPAAATPYLDVLQSRPMVAHLGLAGAALVLVAVLAAAQELMDAGAPGAGAALAGCAAGAGLVGATFVGAGWLSRPWRPDSLQLALSAAAVAGGIVAVARLRGKPGRRIGVRVALAGVLATLVAFLPAVVTLERVAKLLEVSGNSLARRSYVMVGVLGLATLIIAALSAALAGMWAGVAALTAAMVQAGVAAPMLLGLSGVASHRTFAVLVALAGLAAGIAAGMTRWRSVLAMAGTVVSGLGVLVLVAATGGVPEKVVTQARWIPAGLLLALLVATVTCTVAASAPSATKSGALPAVLGPIVGGLAVGGREALTLTQLNDGQPEPSYLNAAHHMGSSSALLFVVALLVAFLAAARFLIAQRNEDTHSTPTPN
ncbi:hypothetical protein [Actinomadura rudentiformis]|uniref:hypothetical protein n=1 Tax=Actinomadura rudentiformis TaxID=359158 RepID=UPI00178C502E|nr:hypothetical protein [Actinomadura rudentiformis]